jgi:predicted acylesterase/phospholipase RssA
MSFPTIKHLVLSGGGMAGFTTYGVLRESNKSGFWAIENIETIYGTSIGALIAVMFALKYDWSEMDDYVIKRPWENVMKMGIDAIVQLFNAKGIFGKKVIEETLSPLLKGKDLSTSITMKELYEYSNIDIHIFTTEIHTYTSIDISHKTHPDWSVIDAVYCSACLPIVFMPFICDDKCYVDGGVINNYPISICIENGADPKTIFGITISKNETKSNIITGDSSLFDYLLVILNKMYKYSCLACNKPVMCDIPYEVELDSAMATLNDIMNVLQSQDERYRLIHNGVELWKQFMNKYALEDNLPSFNVSPERGTSVGDETPV